MLPIEQGVGIGIALSLLHGIWSTTRARRRRLRTRAGNLDLVAVESDIFPASRSPASLSSDFRRRCRFSMPIISGATSWTPCNPQPQKARLMVLEATGIVEIDFTAAQILSDLIRRCHADGVDFAIARLESIRAQEAMARFGINELLGPDHSVPQRRGGHPGARQKARSARRPRTVTQRLTPARMEGRMRQVWRGFPFVPKRPFDRCQSGDRGSGIIISWHFTDFRCAIPSTELTVTAMTGRRWRTISMPCCSRPVSFKGWFRSIPRFRETGRSGSTRTRGWSAFSPLRPACRSCCVRTGSATSPPKRMRAGARSERSPCRSARARGPRV